MATWKRLTEKDGNHVDVNMEQVAFMRRFDDVTLLHFGTMDGAKLMLVQVKETSEEIHMAKPLRSF